MKTTRAAFLLIISALFIVSLSGAALAGDKKHSYKVTNKADYQYDCEIKMVFSNGDEAEFKEIKQNQSVEKESKKCLKVLSGCCTAFKWTGSSYPPYGVSAGCNAIDAIRDQNICGDAAFEIRPGQTAGFAVFVRVQ